MNKKVGILNFQYSNHNYGAVLQAVALQEALIKLSIDSEHIDYRPLTIYKNITLFKKVRVLIGKLFRILKILPPSYIKYSPLQTGVFENFRLTYLYRGKKVYSYNEIKSVVGLYEAVIVGSDQVWRLKYTKKNALIYFLSFVPSSIKRISYAASFGVSEWEKTSKRLEKKIKNELSKFDALSVREHSGVRICKDLLGVQAAHVLDPTLLVDLNFYSKIISTHSPHLVSSDVVYYVLDITTSTVNEINKFSRSLNYTVENIYFKLTGSDSYEFNTVPDWLFKLANSKLVVTDSFHCICFAIIFKKKFIYLANQSRGEARVKSLLKCLEMSGYILDYPSEKDMLKVINSDFDFHEIHKKLDVLKVQSLLFLEKALK